MAERRKIERRGREGRREHREEPNMRVTAERVWYSPAVRVLSTQLGIDPATVTGTGRNGRVTRNDMLAAAGSGVGANRESPGVLPEPTRPSDSALIPLTRIRRMTAANLTRTVREVPMERSYTHVDWT